MFEDLTLDKTNKPLYKQLSTILISAIVNKKLHSGDRLPTIRELSTQLEVNSVTVINAYKELESKGYLMKKVGSGSFVQIPKTYSSSIIDFTGKNSHIYNFPINDIKESVMNTLNEEGVNSFMYEDVRGNSLLQNEISSYLEHYNIHVSPDTVQIVSGGQQALDIISKSILTFGETVFTESPTYLGALQSFLNRESRIIEIDLEDDGLNLLDLESKIVLRKPALLYITPFNQKPMGINYSLEKKSEILRLAEKYKFYIIEDDQGSEITPAESPETLKSMDTYDRVFYIKSFSPLFMPGLRLGALIPPQKTVEKLIKNKKSTDISTSGLIQRSFAYYLGKGDWKEYYKKLKQELTDKIELTDQILDRDFKRLIDYKTGRSSYTYWIRVRAGRCNTITERCREQNVLITPGSYLGEEYSSYIRLNLNSVPLDQIEQGLNVFKSVLISEGL